MSATTTQALASLLLFYRALLSFIWFSDREAGMLDAVSNKLFGGNTKRAVHTYSLARTFLTFDLLHYRALTFGTDIRDNLRNLAIPGTGIALSFFVFNRWLALIVILVVHPLSALGAAIFQSGKGSEKRNVAELFDELLLEPTRSHWFGIWRLNCALVADHSLHLATSAAAVDRDAGREYDLEDKGAFLIEGDKAGVPVTPFLKGKAFERLIVKHKAIEGGMGIHCFDNFTVPGGQWIIQQRLRNARCLARLLPEDAPLSTLRVITASSKWMRGQQSNHTDNDSDISGNDAEDDDHDDYQVFTVVFRAGLKGASTDHKSICFSVDRSSGVIQEGISNQHWYKLGVASNLGRLGDSYGKVYQHHPDTGMRLTGEVIPGLGEALKLVLASHKRLVPHVPLVGWDVALVDDNDSTDDDSDNEKARIALLEINISCNFFNGSHDREAYLDFIVDNYRALERARMGMTSTRPRHTTKSQTNARAGADSSSDEVAEAPAPASNSAGSVDNTLLVPSPLLKPRVRGRSGEIPAPTSLVALDSLPSPTGGSDRSRSPPAISSPSTSSALQAVAGHDTGITAAAAVAKGLESSIALVRSLSSSPLAFNGATSTPSPPLLPPSVASAAGSTFSSSPVPPTALLPAGGGTLLPLPLRSTSSASSASGHSSGAGGGDIDITHNVDRIRAIALGLGRSASSGSASHDSPSLLAAVASGSLSMDDEDELLDSPAPVAHVSPAAAASAFAAASSSATSPHASSSMPAAAAAKGSSSSGLGLGDMRTGGGERVGFGFVLSPVNASAASALALAVDTRTSSSSTPTVSASATEAAGTPTHHSSLTASTTSTTTNATSSPMSAFSEQAANVGSTPAPAAVMSPRARLLSLSLNGAAAASVVQLSSAASCSAAPVAPLAGALPSYESSDDSGSESLKRAAASTGASNESEKDEEAAAIAVVGKAGAKGARGQGVGHAKRKGGGAGSSKLHA